MSSFVCIKNSPTRLPALSFPGRRSSGSVGSPLTQTNIGFIYSAAIVFLYYVLQSSSGALGEAGRIDPLLAAWLPNIVIGTLGGVIFTSRK